MTQTLTAPTHTEFLQQEAKEERRFKRLFRLVCGMKETPNQLLEFKALCYQESVNRLGEEAAALREKEIQRISRILINERHNRRWTEE